MTDHAGRVDARSELRVLLVKERDLVDQLMARADDRRVGPAQLVDLAEGLQTLETLRAELIEALREEASEARRRQEERSVRQFVLRALDEVGCPQNAAFLQEYVWARDRVSLDSRGFGALRRDERRAWDRNPGRRLAYVVSAMGPDGRLLARWMARSDWPVEKRLVLPGDERLLDLKKLEALFRARKEVDNLDEADPFGPLIEKYAIALSSEAAPSTIGDLAEREVWYQKRQQECEAEIRVMERATATTRQGTIARLARLPEDRLIWGSSSPVAV